MLFRQPSSEHTASVILLSQIREQYGGGIYISVPPYDGKNTHLIGVLTKDNLSFNLPYPLPKIGAVNCLRMDVLFQVNCM